MLQGLALIFLGGMALGRLSSQLRFLLLAVLLTSFPSAVDGGSAHLMVTFILYQLVH